MTIDIFVYGTLKPGYRYYQRSCIGKTICERAAIAYGQLYHLPTLGYPAMIPGSDRVCGYLLGFNDREILAELDDLEGYHPHRAAEQNEYDRTRIEVFDADNPEISLGFAWVYQQTLHRVRQLNGILLTSGCRTVQLTDRLKVKGILKKGFRVIAQWY
ncbi:MAG TPA: gamma-glutamylcyclotransferase [Oscillatoriales cyanobacterium M59_W2019_021]|nr:MAG: gamma-glutamylcyclotransferase [Cyanobacteria bacterium J055]HIK33897.1 gamma-glutamylcyclotransferase [Oscillatoriales cyanobacterium M4454_W2019_049]HIK49927.1 gamma-glutamylcyclotransferase [Oscillatoriales cyanobacterium M59_W2019_021]